jgi:hypothetical protein
VQGWCGDEQSGRQRLPSSLRPRVRERRAVPKFASIGSPYFGMMLAVMAVVLILSNIGASKGVAIGPVITDGGFFLFPADGIPRRGRIRGHPDLLQHRCLRDRDCRRRGVAVLDKGACARQTQLRSSDL